MVMNEDLTKFQVFISGTVDKIVESYTSVKNARNRANVITLAKNGIDVRQQSEELEIV